MKSARYSLICLILTIDNYLIRANSFYYENKSDDNLYNYFLQGGGGETDWLLESQWMGLLKNFKRWKKIVIISGKYHVIRSLLPLLLTRAERILVALYCIMYCSALTVQAVMRASVLKVIIK